jgi:hypothetical protein
MEAEVQTMADQPGGYVDGSDGQGPEDDRRSPWLYVLLTVVGLAVVGLAAWLFLRTSGDAEPTASPSASTSEPTVTETATTTATTTTTPTPTPSETADLGDFSTDPVVENGYPELGDPIGYGTAVRVGHHDGYDRVVFEFSGSGTPSYRVQYTDTPTAQGSGDPVDVAGDAYLHVSVTSVGIPDEPAPSMTTPSTDGTVFAQVEGIWGGFEGYGESFIGIDGGQRPFHVMVLQDPMRVVVDVANG